MLAPSDFVVSDPDAWVKSDKTGRLDLVRTSKYSPPHRSPVSLAILEGQEWASFELEVQARSTGRVYGHQDLCLIFGYQDPAHFYYVHLAPAPDAHAHNIFLVDGAARRALLPIPEYGLDWGRDWHSLRLVRDGEEGSVAVFVDGAAVPVLETVDLTFPKGAIGVGSFDDTGDFRDMRLRVSR